MVAVSVGDGESDPSVFAEAHNIVSLCRGAHEGFLGIDAAHAVLNRRKNHCVMLVDMPRSYCGNIRADFPEHVSVVGEGLCSSETFLRSDQALRVWIGDPALHFAPKLLVMQLGHA